MTCVTRFRKCLGKIGGRNWAPVSNSRLSWNRKSLPYNSHGRCICNTSILRMDNKSNNDRAVIQALTEEEHAIKCAAKVNLVTVQSKIKAQMEPDIKIGNCLLKIVENRYVITTKKKPLTTVVTYEAPYELAHVY